MSPLHLRPAMPDDAELLHALIVELAVYEREPDAVEATPADLRSQLEQPQQGRAKAQGSIGVGEVALREQHLGRFDPQLIEGAGVQSDESALPRGGTGLANAQ